MMVVMWVDSMDKLSAVLLAEKMVLMTVGMMVEVTA